MNLKSKKLETEAYANETSTQMALKKEIIKIYNSDEMNEENTILIDSEVDPVDIEKIKNVYSSAKKLFLERLNYNYDKFTKSIPYPKLRIRKMTTRWGVCNIKTHIITLNLELMKRDIGYLDYVIIHEMSHLIHGDHSRSFWKLVEQNMPDYKKYREEMKEF